MATNFYFGASKFLPLEIYIRSLFDWPTYNAGRKIAHTIDNISANVEHTDLVGTTTIYIRRYVENKFSH